MKSFYKLIVSISCLFALSSCEGYLDVEQPSIYTDQNYYKTPQDFETAINGCYAQLQTIYNKNYMEAIVTRADEARYSTPLGRFMGTDGEQMVKALVGLVDTGVSLQSIIKQDRCSGFYR